MTLSQFELATWLRCPETDAEGYRCSKPPSHPGPHLFARCPAIDLRRHRCMLPPNHPGNHELPWYDGPTAPGEIHRLTYRGTKAETSALAERATGIFGKYGWVEQSREFALDLTWRTPLAGFLGLFADPTGGLKIVYQYRELARDAPEPDPVNADA